MRSKEIGDPSISSAIASSLNLLLQKFFNYAPGSQKKLALMEGKVLRVVCTAPALELWFKTCPEGARVFGYCEETADCEIQGSLANIFLLIANQPTNFSGTGVEVRGDASLLADLRENFSETDFDWEAPLHDVLGDFAGPSAAHFLGKFFNKTTIIAKKTPSYFAEYLSEETRHLVSTLEFATFENQLQIIREQCDRLEARLNKLTTG